MEKNRLGMALFLASEAVFFLLLIIAYVYIGLAVTNGPRADNSLDPGRTAIFTLFLLASSGTVWLAGRTLKAGSGRPWFWLAATIVLGAVFLAGQGTEWGQLIGRGVKISSNGFGTGFFTLTGFHGLHVTIGLIALAVLLGLSLWGRRGGISRTALETVSLYWHFVDVVWIVIYSVIYLTVFFHLV